MKKTLWHIDMAASWLFASVLVASALPVHATELKWFYVRMDKSASLAELCVALPSDVSPEASLAENVQGGVKLDFTDKTEEGEIKVFSSKTGSNYAFATTPKACATFRQNMMAAAEQRKLSPLWLVADGARNACRPLTEFFPPVGSIPGAAIPTAAQQAARMADMQPELKFLSPRFASLTVTLPNQNKKTFSIFSKKSECAAYLVGLHKVLQDQPGNTGKSAPVEGPRFGMYSGETGDMKVGVETQPQGTALVVVNKASNDFTFEPMTIVLEAGPMKVSPCTAYLLSLQGIGVATVVAVKAKSTEGYMLGSCPSHDNNGKMGDRLVFNRPITAVVIGGVRVKMRRDN